MRAVGFTSLRVWLTQIENRANYYSVKLFLSIFQMSSLLSLNWPFLRKLGECPFLRTPLYVTHVVSEALFSLWVFLLFIVYCSFVNGAMVMEWYLTGSSHGELPTLKDFTIPWGIQCSIRQHWFDAEGSVTATLVMWSPQLYHIFPGSSRRADLLRSSHPFSSFGPNFSLWNQEFGLLAPMTISATFNQIILMLPVWQS